MKQQKLDFKKPIYFFTGTTLFESDINNYSNLNFYFRPPLQRQDIEKLLSEEHSVGTIVIVDGFYHSNLAVSMREIRNAIQLGWTIIGVSSMGALRAIEGQPLGMQGFGIIYRWLRLFKVADDDEVAQVVDPDSFKPLSISMVEIRDHIRYLRKNRFISIDEATRIVSKCKALYFPDRTLKQLCRIIETETAARFTASSLEPRKANAISIKRRDAVLLLTLLLK